jgi:hypothetical protein
MNSNSSILGIPGDVLDRVAQFAQMSYMKLMRHPCPKGAVLGKNEVCLFGDHEWKERREKLDQKLQLYDM